MTAVGWSLLPLWVDTASSVLQAADVRAVIRRLPAAKTDAGPFRRIGRSVYGVVVSPLYPATGRSRRENFCRRTSGVGRWRPLANRGAPQDRVAPITHCGET